MINPQNAVTLTPNAVLVPSIQINTTINSAGKLVTGCRIFLQPAVVANAGTSSEAWTAAGPAKVVGDITDVTALPSDLAGVAADMATAQAAVLAVVGAINAVRKLV